MLSLPSSPKVTTDSTGQQKFLLFPQNVKCEIFKRVPLSFRYMKPMTRCRKKLMAYRKTRLKEKRPVTKVTWFSPWKYQRGGSISRPKPVCTSFSLEKSFNNLMAGNR